MTARNTTDSVEQTRAWLALNRLYKLKPLTVNRLIEAFGDPITLLNAAPASIEASGFSLKEAIQLQNVNWEQADQDLQWLQAKPERHLLHLHDERYPQLLKTIADPPPLLFVLGDPEVLRVPQLGIVGTRNPTSSGRQHAENFAKHLAQHGITITSGLALGIDGAAHQGALNANGLTIAVCGTGLDRIYPARHHQLGKDILREGALISEFSPGTPGRPANFPRRNRIISGLSLGLLVVEAAERSGSLISARLANEQGREVFAIPGSINNPLARGCHKIIKQGAKLVESADDILYELGDKLVNAGWQNNVALEPEDSATTSSGSNSPDTQNDVAAFENLGKTNENLLKLIAYEPIAIDTLVAQSGLSAQAIATQLMELELMGQIESVAGGAVIRK